MSAVAVKKVKAPEREESFLAEFRKTFEGIQRRAFELFQKRNGGWGSEITDWFNAEHELLNVPASELIEKENEFRLNVAVPGLEPKDIKVTATPSTLIVEGETTRSQEEKESNVLFREFSEKKIYRKVDFPSNVDVDKVTASLDKGMLVITAPKAAATQRKEVKVAA